MYSNSRFLSDKTTLIYFNPDCQCLPDFEICWNLSNLVKCIKNLAQNIIITKKFGLESFCQTLLLKLHNLRFILLKFNNEN